jgi:hypothetical protein
MAVLELEQMGVRHGELVALGRATSGDLRPRMGDMLQSGRSRPGQRRRTSADGRYTLPVGSPGR